MRSRAVIAFVTRLVALASFVGCSSAPVAETPASTPRAPIVLVHGIAGFPWATGMPYFKGLPEALAARGDVAVLAAVPPYDDSLARARVLQATVDDVLARTGASAVHLLAHSQGGLDARYLVEELGYAERVISVTTLSTPHHGTPVADFFHRLVPDVVLDATLGVHGLFIGAPTGTSFPLPDGSAAVNALTSDYRARENARATPTSVPFFSFAGVTGGVDDEVCGRGLLVARARPSAPQVSLVPTWAYLASIGPGLANDGLVPARSAVYGTFLGCLPADHFELMGYGGMAARGEGTVELDFVRFFTAYVDRLRVLEETGSVAAMLEGQAPRLDDPRAAFTFARALDTGAGPPR